MKPTFVYGTLLADEVLAALLGRVPTTRAATLGGFARCRVRGAPFPAIVQRGRAAVDGTLLLGLSARDERALDYFEDEAYEKTAVLVETARGAEEAAAYVWRADAEEALELERPWDYAEFRSRELARYVKHVCEPCAAEFALFDAGG